MKFKVTMKDPDTLHDAIGEAVEAQIKEIGITDADEIEALKVIVPPVGMDGWWCPSCKSEVDATYHEHCANCGTFIGDKQPSTEWAIKARAALALTQVRK